MESQPYSSYFLFINSGSGGGIGHNLLQQQVKTINDQKQAQKISFDISLEDSLNQINKKKIDVYFYNMKTTRQKGFKNLKSITDKNHKTQIIVCGGDGTVMWVISQLYNHKIDTEKTPIGIIPLGTGNDFSQYLGWGKLKTMLTQKSFRSLKKLLRKWQHASVQYFDVWDMKAEVYDYGKFQKVENTKNSLIQSKVIQKSFCNYFSFGIDGKIGYSFDMHRTQSRLGNLAMYGTLGLIKAMTRTKTLNELVYGMEIRPQLSQNIQQQNQSTLKPKSSIKQTTVKQNTEISQKQQGNCLLNALSSENKKNNSNQPSTLIQYDSKRNLNQQLKKSKIQKPKQYCFVTKNSKKQIQIPQLKSIQLKSQYYNIVALNINSFMGGVTDIWKHAKVAIKNQHSNSFSQTSSNDGKLQFISFCSSIGMAAQRSISGNGQKIAQGSGPFYFEFKPYDPKQKHRTYLQFDGQFIRFTHPKSVLIKKSIYGKNGKIKVLRNVQSVSGMRESI